MQEESIGDKDDEFDLGQVEFLVLAAHPTEVTEVSVQLEGRLWSAWSAVSQWWLKS